MRNGLRGIVMVVLAMLMLAACGGRRDVPNLMELKSTSPGPDEFAILPGKPLQAPESYQALPEPTPGSSNITDPTPIADAVEALGGRGEVLQRTGTYGADGGLISHTTRFGITPGIREQLATEDLDFRRNNRGRILERIFNVNTYYQAYEKQSLNRYQELLRFRRLGVRTPSAPPNSAPE